MTALRRWLAPTGVKRIAFFLVADLVVVAVAMWAAFELRFDWHVPYLPAPPRRFPLLELQVPHNSAAFLSEVLPPFE